MEKFGYVLATKMLVENRRKVRFMYHENADNDQDSGWRFFCGDEDDDYANNPDNIAIYDIHTIVDIDESIRSFLGAVAGTAFEREDEKTDFVEVKDFFVERGVSRYDTAQTIHSQ